MVELRNKTSVLMVTYICDTHGSTDTESTERYEHEEGSGSGEFSRIKKKSEHGKVRKL